MKRFVLVTLLFDGQAPEGFYNHETKQIKLDGLSECAISAEFVLSEQSIALAHNPADIVKGHTRPAMLALSGRIDAYVDGKYGEPHADAPQLTENRT